MPASPRRGIKLSRSHSSKTGRSSDTFGLSAALAALAALTKATPQLRVVDGVDVPKERTRGCWLVHDSLTGRSLDTFRLSADRAALVKATSLLRQLALGAGVPNEGCARGCLLVHDRSTDRDRGPHLVAAAGIFGCIEA